MVVIATSLAIGLVSMVESTILPIVESTILSDIYLRPLDRLAVRIERGEYAAQLELDLEILHVGAQTLVETGRLEPLGRRHRGRVLGAMVMTSQGEGRKERKERGMRQIKVVRIHLFQYNKNIRRQIVVGCGESR